MNIAVINIKDLVKYFLAIVILLLIAIAGIKIVKGKEELVSETLVDTKSSSFLYCLEMEVPLLASDKPKKEQKDESSTRFLDTQLAMLYNMEEKEIKEENTKEVAELTDEEKNEDKEKEITQENKIQTGEKLDTKVIEENNITPSFTDTGNDIQIKNQSKYDVKDLLANSNYELKNKNKVIIYHTHTCESYTSSEKHSYEMTGAYRTTNLNFTVARVRR